MKRIFAALLLVAMLAACLSGCGSDKGGEKPAPVTTLGGSGETQPAVTQPADNKPAATWPVASQPAQTQPAVVQPSDGNSIEGTWTYERSIIQNVYNLVLVDSNVATDFTVNCYVKFDSDGVVSTYYDYDYDKADLKADVIARLQRVFPELMRKVAESNGADYDKELKKKIAQCGSEELALASWFEVYYPDAEIDQMVKNLQDVLDDLDAITEATPDKEIYDVSGDQLTVESLDGEVGVMTFKIEGDTMTLSAEETDATLVLHRK